MANVKISELPNVTVLLGTEYIPVVQSGETRKVSVSDLASSGGAVKFARINATADGDNTVIAAVAGKKLRVVSYVVVGNATGTISFKSAVSTVLASFPVAANGGVSFGGDASAPAFETTSGEALVLNNSTGLDSVGHLAYLEV